jgi:hypothetical protein
MAESDLAEITEIIKKIEERTIYKDIQEEEKYKTEYKRLCNIDNDRFQGQSNTEHRNDASRAYKYQYDKFKEIKEKYSDEENKVFLDFLTNEAKPAIQNIIDKNNGEIIKLEPIKNELTSTRIQWLYTYATGKPNNSDIARNESSNEINRLKNVNYELNKQFAQITTLIKVYEEVKNGGKYKTRRNINKKYKKSVKKYKKSYRRR